MEEKKIKLIRIDLLFPLTQLIYFGCESWGKRGYIPYTKAENDNTNPLQNKTETT